MSDIKSMYPSFQPLFDKLLQDLTVAEREQVEINLFIISVPKGLPLRDRVARLKKFELDGLKPEKRADKLKKWSEGNRFVAVVKKGDEIYAHVNSQIANQIPNQKLTLDGKDVSVQALDAADYAQLSEIAANIKAAFEAFPEDKIQKQPAQPSYRQDLRRVLERLQHDHMIMSMMMKIENIPDKIKRAILEKMKENMQEIERIKKEQDEKDLKKAKDITQDEIAKKIEQADILAGEVGKQNSNQRLEQAEETEKRSDLTLRRAEETEQEATFGKVEGDLESQTRREVPHPSEDNNLS